MMLTMDISELGGILEEYVQRGYAQAVKAYDEPNDRIKKTNIKDWLKFNNYDFRTFINLEDKKMIKPFRIGESRNSAIYYSKEEIKKAFACLKVKRIIDRNLLKVK